MDFLYSYLPSTIFFPTVFDFLDEGISCKKQRQLELSRQHRLRTIMKSIFLLFFNELVFISKIVTLALSRLFILTMRVQTATSEGKVGLVFSQRWQNKKQHMEDIIPFVKNYNKLKPTRQATNTMEEFAKEEEFNKQEMNQNQSSNKSFHTTSRSGPPESQRYFENENNLPIPVKIQNEVSEPFQRQGEFNSQSEYSAVRPSSKKSSIYHNFQKHLITTLKLHVNFSNWKRNNSTADRLMIEMWEFFIRSNRPTKRYLYSLLMNIPENIIEFKNKYSDKAHQQEFQRTISEASPQDLVKAQKNLRFHLMKQCKKMVENELLNHRRMHKIDEFKEYFNTFISDLENGELNLRLPKPKNRKETGHVIKRSSINQSSSQKYKQK